MRPGGVAVGGVAVGGVAVVYDDGVRLLDEGSPTGAAARRGPAAAVELKTRRIFSRTPGIAAPSASPRSRFTLLTCSALTALRGDRLGDAGGDGDRRARPGPRAAVGGEAERRGRRPPAMASTAAATVARSSSADADEEGAGARGRAFAGAAVVVLVVGGRVGPRRAVAAAAAVPKELGREGEHGEMRDGGGRASAEPYPGPVARVSDRDDPSRSADVGVMGRRARRLSPEGCWGKGVCQGTYG